MTEPVDQHHLPTCPVDACVMRICDKGCRFVYQTIDRMRDGFDVCDTEKLSKEQHGLVLTELEEVMAVYGGRVCDME